MKSTVNGSKSLRSKGAVALSLSVLWLLFTVSLTTWWVVFGLRQIEKIAGFSNESSAEIARSQKMLFWEGSSLIVSLCLGGGALIYYIARQMGEARRQREFFAAFTHEIKTPLANIRLKGELLEEKIADDGKRSLLRDISDDITRIDLQLENSVFVAQENAVFLFPEKIKLRDFVQGMSIQFPLLAIQLNENEDVTLFCDRRALETIFRNIFYNAQSHGRATAATVTARWRSDSSLEIEISDNGAGFQGDPGSHSKLGKPFYRPLKSSGSGIGLYIVKSLMKLIGGKVQLPRPEKGFTIILIFPGS